MKIEWSMKFKWFSFVTTPRARYGCVFAQHEKPDQTDGRIELSGEACTQSVQ